MKTLAPVVVATVKPRSSDKANGERPATPPPGPLGPQGHLKLSARQRQALLEQFATLVDSGIQVAQALTAMRQQGVDPQQEPVLRSLEQAVTAGLPLSTAMAALPRAFPPLLVQMVRAGEATGQLGDMLLRTVEALEADAALRARLRSALIYPAVMLVLTIGVVVFLLTYIVPKFERMLRGKVLPAPTQALLAVGDFLQVHGVWLGLGVVTALVGTVLALRTPGGRRWLDRSLLRLPVLGPLVRTAALARSTRTFGLLVQAGVPVHTALEHTQAVAGNEAYRTLWERAQRQVTNGGSLLDAVRGQPLLGPNFEQLVAAGESTATLDRVLLKVGTQMTKDLERRVRDLVTLLEPVMVVVMASVVGFVALSIMLPIFQMSRH
ncbi:MAG: type II secretion system F family protein [Planctomycetes bacterium]|nr:type II secretion system F family protein [Planctomycetota bacterium]